LDYPAEEDIYNQEEKIKILIRKTSILKNQLTRKKVNGMKIPLILIKKT